MSGWVSSTLYAPLPVLAAGLLTFAGIVGIGRLAIRLLLRRGPLPGAWSGIVASLLGVQLVSLAVQLLAMRAAATRPCLLALLGLVWLAGVVELLRAARSLRARASAPGEWPPLALAAAAIVGVSLAANLLIAMAPSTKADEIYYHMLAPARVVHDAALRFYLYPLLAASLPQLGYQLAGAPLHAAGLPDALNVVSWAFSATMCWFFFWLLRDAGRSNTWALAACAALFAGLHTAVWHVTGGSHAMGELALAALVLAVVMPETIPTREARVAALVIGTCASAAAASKISTMPIAVVLLAVGVMQLARSTPRDAAAVIGLALGPMLCFVLPLVIWTWSASGAPLGPMLSWWFPGSVYASLPVRDQLYREPNSLWQLATRHSPLLWLAMAGAVFASALPARRRLLVALLLAGQGLAIAFLLPVDPRFLGGLTFGCAMIFALAPASWLLARLASPMLRWAALGILVMPWLALALYYARPFAEVAMGISPPERFRERYVAFERDYRALDTILPRNAVLYAADGIRISVYSPRPAAWTAADIPAGAEVFQFARSCEPLDAAFTGADTAYANPAASSVVYRDPRRLPLAQPLCVRRLVRSRR